MDVDYDDANDGGDLEEDAHGLNATNGSNINVGSGKEANLSAALIASPSNVLLEQAQVFVKLLKRLKAAIEEDARDYGFRELLNDINVYDKKYKFNGMLLKRIRDSFDALNENRSFSRKQFELYKQHLNSHIDVYHRAYSDCVMAFVKDSPDVSKDALLLAEESWKNAKESIAVIAFASKALFIEGGTCLIRMVRSRINPVLDTSVDLLVRALSQKYPPETLGLTIESKSNHFSFDTEMSQFSSLLESLSQVPVADVDAVYLELNSLLQSVRQHSKFIRSIGGSVPSAHAPMDSSSEDEMVLSSEELSAMPASFSGADLSAAEFSVVSGAKSLCKLTITVLEDLMRFIKDQYQFDQNLCWNCYGVHWLEGIARVGRGIADQIEELASVVTPPQRAELVVRSVRFLRVHIKALLDLASGHDQFQECEIPSAKETFKSGHYWNHKMVRRLQTSFDTVMLQLYRMGI